MRWNLIASSLFSYMQIVMVFESNPLSPVLPPQKRPQKRRKRRRCNLSGCCEWCLGGRRGEGARSIKQSNASKGFTRAHSLTRQTDGMSPRTSYACCGIFTSHHMLKREKQSQLEHVRWYLIWQIIQADTIRTNCSRIPIKLYYQAEISLLISARIRKQKAAKFIFRVGGIWQLQMEN